MEKTFVNIAKNDGQVQSKAAELFSIEGYTEVFAVHEGDNLDIMTDKPTYDVTEVSTGMKVCGGEKTKKKAIAKADIRMRSNIIHWESVKIKAIEQLAKSGIIYPVNKV